MADKTGIEWTDASWNPIVGCTIVSKGCTNCYAMKMAARVEKMAAATGTPTPYEGTTMKTKAGPVWTGKVAEASEATLLAPLRWKRPRRIFVNSMGDLFHEGITDEQIDRVFAVMALCPQHTFQVLTKRPERMREYVEGSDRDGARRFKIADAALSLGRNLPDNHPGWQRQNWKPSVVQGLTQPARWPLPNVWLGVSVEDQATANERIPILLDTPAAIRFISAEPLLGPVDLTLDGLVRLPCRNAGDGLSMDPATGAYECCRACDYTGIGSEWGIDWVIVGGESGPGARPMHPDWARSLRDQCADAGVPFFFKQWGDWAPDFETWAINPPDDDTQCKYDTAVWCDLEKKWDRTNGAWDDGENWYIASNYQEPEQPITRIGKKRAGNLLDGVQHHNWPEVR